MKGEDMQLAKDDCVDIYCAVIDTLNRHRSDDQWATRLSRILEIIGPEGELLYDALNITSGTYTADIP